MRLLTKRCIDSGKYVAESRRVSGVGERLQRGGAFSCRKIQFACTTLSDIDGNDASDFLSERLNGNWMIPLLALSHQLYRFLDVHG
jgi:hypothetical protein